MQLKNAKLIALVGKLGEDKVLDLLVKKMADDDARRDYHKKYNAKKNAVLREVKRVHPELFKVVGR